MQCLDAVLLKGKQNIGCVDCPCIICVYHMVVGFSRTLQAFGRLRFFYIHYIQMIVVSRLKSETSKGLLSIWDMFVGYTNVSIHIWMFPKIVVPPNHPF